MFSRYAIYFTPRGLLAETGANWLGWDMACAQEVAHPVVGDLGVASLTERPRKYGFHGTIKAPFALAQGCDVAQLRRAFDTLCADLQPVVLEGLHVAALGRFLALVPQGEQANLRDLASEVVRLLDPFRAPATAHELARRRRANLSPHQDALLLHWGYPHVMDQFRFHMTLTGPVPRGEVENVQTKVATHFAPALPTPFTVDSLTLAGERPDGRFVQIIHAPLGAIL